MLDASADSVPAWDVYVKFRRTHRGKYDVDVHLVKRRGPDPRVPPEGFALGELADTIFAFTAIEALEHVRDWQFHGFEKKFDEAIERYRAACPSEEPQHA